MRLIDADALKEYRCSICDNRERCEDRETVCSDIAEIDEQPTIEAEPVKDGKWIKGKDWDEWFCSVCRNYAYLDYKENPILSDYCPHCGARMDGGKNERRKGK